MAKLTARGTTVIGKVHYTTTFDAAGVPQTVTGIFALRSDRKVLHRLTGEYGSGYSIKGTLKADRPLTIETLRNMVQGKGYTITKEELG